jgi:hypothetical protein
MGSLSERDRLRLAELMRAPLVDPRQPEEPPEIHRWRGTQRAIDQARQKLRSWLQAQSTAPVTQHVAGHWRQWAAGGVVLVLCLVVLGGVVKIESRSGAASIQLQALDRQGQLQIRWDPESDLVRQATGAKLFIIDGAERLYVKLDGARLRRGAVSYPRRSNRVELRLALAEPDGRQVEQQATFVVSRPPSSDPSQLVAKARPAPFSAGMPPADQPRAVTVAEHRARRKPVELSGSELPFTCSAGDIFHKTGAPSGWDTFSCRGKNVWSVFKNQAQDGRPAGKPTADANAPAATAARATT